MELELDLVTIDDHRQHRLTNYFFADLAEPLFEAIQRHDRFRHGTVAARAADVVVEPLHNLTGALDVADIAYRNHHPVFYQTGDHAPINAFDLQAEFGQLRNHVFAIDFTQMNHRNTVIDLKPAQCAPHRLEIFARQRRSLDARDHRLVSERIQKIERAQVGQVATPLEK